MKFIQGIILLFSKYPTPGKAKTRLIPKLGAAGAARLQSKMGRQAAATVSSFCVKHGCSMRIYYEGGSLAEMGQWLGKGHSYAKQTQGDLGRRMARGFEDHLASHQAVVIIGTDCPAISDAELHEALEALEKVDVVLGPTHDGGYYLIGALTKLGKRRINSLFDKIDWGSSKVLQQTLERIQQENLDFHLLRKLHDIDTPEDLTHYHHHTNPQ